MKNRDYLDIDRIAFIGRTYFEYMRMFDLDESMLSQGRVLDCGSGPSSFNTEAYQRGFDVISCDILYDLPPDRLFEKGKNDIEHVFQKVDGVPHLYTWKYYKNRAEIISLRHKALDLFSRDFEKGRTQGRYLHARLPRLPFQDEQFRLVLSAHFLFLYGDRLDIDFHKECLTEMFRVCSGEVRVYPLQGLNAKPYPHLDEVTAFLEAENIAVEIVEVPFEFQKGSNKIMKLSRK